jgi:putative N6-adenine-specific DNA methylase
MTCPRGLEPTLSQELNELGIVKLQATEGGVAWEGSMEDMMRANLYSRTASRLLWRVAQGPYKDVQDIYKITQRVSWPKYFDTHQTFRVFSEGRKHTLKSLDFATLTVKDAVCDQFRAHCQIRPSIDSNPDIRIHLFVDAEYASIYLDTSGEALFKRGWRIEHFSAPLRENLAAGILKLTGWTSDQPLYDFMCGSGTFLIEAAHMAKRIPPGLSRSFGFERIKNIPINAWENIKEIAKKEIIDPELKLFGNDIDHQAVALTQRYINQLGLNHSIQLSHQDCLSTLAPEKSGIMLANPPYGVRLEELEHLTTWYPLIGDWLKKQFSGWNAYILTSDLRLPKLIGLTPKNKTPLFNGALECRLYRFPLVKGTHRPRANLSQDSNLLKNDK